MLALVVIWQWALNALLAHGFDPLDPKPLYCPNNGVAADVITTFFGCKDYQPDVAVWAQAVPDNPKIWTPVVNTREDNPYIVTPSGRTTCVPAAPDVYQCKFKADPKDNLRDVVARGFNPAQKTLLPPGFGSYWVTGENAQRLAYAVGTDRPNQSIMWGAYGLFIPDDLLKEIQSKRGEENARRIEAGEQVSFPGKPWLVSIPPTIHRYVKVSTTSVFTLKRRPTSPIVGLLFGASATLLAQTFIKSGADLFFYVYHRVMGVNNFWIATPVKVLTETILSSSLKASIRAEQSPEEVVTLDIADRSYEVPKCTLKRSELEIVCEKPSGSVAAKDLRTASALRDPQQTQFEYLIAEDMAEERKVREHSPDDETPLINPDLILWPENCVLFLEYGAHAFDFTVFSKLGD